MSEYEKELQTPIKGIMFGSLMTAILIHVIDHICMYVCMYGLFCYQFLQYILTT